MDSNKKSKSYFTWTPELDQVLAACFIDQINLGNRLDGKFAWKSVAWTAAIDALKKVDANVSKTNIQSRLRTWEKYYDIVSKMLSESGFSWNYEKGKVVVEERVWNDYVKSHPLAAPYRSKVCVENWDDICAIFAQDRANGEGAQTALEAEREMTVNNESNDLETRDERSLEDDVAANTFRVQNQQGKSNASSTSHSRKRKQSAMQQSLDRMTDALVNFLKSEPPRATTQMALDEVSKVQDLNETQIIRAVDLLMSDQRKFDTFSGLPNGLKRLWLRIHLGD